jgi:hypothetical protein
MSSYSLPEIVRRLIERGIAAPDTIVGCKPEEVNHIELDQSTVLPLAYREFLLTMGRGAGVLFIGSDVFYPRIIGLKADAAALLIEASDDWSLPQDSCVFFMHQGYQFYYMLSSEGDDPPVYYYFEGRGQPGASAYDSFLEWLWVSQQSTPASLNVIGDLPLPRRSDPDDVR